jgi:phosphoribosylamine--glycine ligase
VRVLVIGGGGREHALTWGLSRSRLAPELFAAPGNPGIAELAELVPSVNINLPQEVVSAARSMDAELVVVGPEAPLVAGVADALRADGRKAFGPGMAAAAVEGSKAHAKALMERAAIPTAAWRKFSEVDAATAYLDELGPPFVIKADGLAAGKGVVVTESRREAVEALRERLEQGAFGDAGRTVVVEEFLDGPEASVIAFVDGKSFIACEPAQDYKRIGTGDRGPNTGGMGSYSPVPVCTPDVMEQIEHEVLAPMVSQMAAEDTPFVGALYAGLALTSKGPKVVEFNARFGDPETQALIPRMESDLLELFFACESGDLAGADLSFSTRPCVSVVLASGGYPGPHETGIPISGLDEASRLDNVVVFQAGTARADPGDVVTAGGRVLAVSALGEDFTDARRRAYGAASLIEFDGKQLRDDIAQRAERSNGT